ncbi:hypothetical protein FB45DRAFT_547379 [Roridomyces roridus]|uniref:Uncharacterized protein n=1 Tax=Roridomyces roridus TaxID=1738132 RepID=A0AAD7FPK5_9AGAR|nr:hypothetical protein FB45DRAFT_547379 [Roridomyces roridus]
MCTGWLFGNHLHVASLRQSPLQCCSSSRVADSTSPIEETWWDQPPNQDAALWEAPLEEEIDPRLLSRDELKIREHQFHVERISSVVSFWRSCVAAACMGEDEMRLEPFLNSLEEENEYDSCAISREGWGLKIGGDAWQWGVVHPKKAYSGSSSSAHGSLTHAGSLTASTSDVPEAGHKAYAFVERIARQESADADRKRRMHKFYQMSTNEKVKKIEEMVRHLHSTSD